MTDLTFDILVIGAGSAGCAAAGRLAERGVKRIAVLEAGPTDSDPRVKIPLALISLMGGRRDWRRMSTPQSALNNRRVRIPRGRIVGGSGSINSMVWFRGRCDDYTAWNVPGWGADAVWPVFDAVEAAVRPESFPTPNPIAAAFGRMFDADDAPPTPERESAGVVRVNMRRARRFSAADAFLRPAQTSGAVTVFPNAQAARLRFDGRRAVGVETVDGRVFHAAAGIVLCAGAIESPAILMRSGVGPAAHLQEHGIAPILNAPDVGSNLQDHPSLALHHTARSGARRYGYGLTLRQSLQWIAAPFTYLFLRRGPLASGTVEACAFYRADGSANGPPDIQTHFIPAKVGWRGRSIVWGSGFLADVCLCRPQSRGRLRLASADPLSAPDIDLGLLRDPQDLALLRAGVRRLRGLLDQTGLLDHADEAFPGRAAASDAELDAFIRARCATAYHPVGTCRMGADDSAPVAPDLTVKGLDALWLADASIFPALTSANTNAPAMMTGWRGGDFAADALTRRSAA